MTNKFSKTCIMAAILNAILDFETLKNAQTSWKCFISFSCASKHMFRHFIYDFGMLGDIKNPIYMAAILDAILDFENFQDIQTSWKSLEVLKS